jgi:hypothetical protein
MNEAQPQLMMLMGVIDNKYLLANNMQLAPWLPQYRAVMPPKYFNDLDPRKFLMCYKAEIASSRGDKGTLAKSFIISLKGIAAN